MNINEVLSESLFFGMIVSLLAYKIGFEIQKKWKKVYLNPLLIAIVLVIVFLLVTGISYETYRYGAKYLSYFLKDYLFVSSHRPYVLFFNINLFILIGG